MPIAILQKAVDELGKDKPRLEYLRGLLETLLEIQPKPAPLQPPSLIPSPSRKAIVVGKLPEKE